MTTYLDSSAIVKLAINEPESAELRRFLRRKRPFVSSALARTEVLRAVVVGGEKAVAKGRAALGRVNLVRVNDRILNAAGTLEPVTLRSLDAIHIATAEAFGRDLRVVVTYDDRMAEAAKQRGHRVASPA